MEDLKQIFMRRVSQIYELDMRARSSLKREGAFFFIQLLAMTESDIARTPGIGKKSRLDIVQSINRAGFAVGVLREHQEQLVPLWPYAKHPIASEEDARRVVGCALESHPEIIEKLKSARALPVATGIIPAASPVPGMP